MIQKDPKCEIEGRERRLTELVSTLGYLSPPPGQRRHLPADAYHVARLQATLVEDCAACWQIEWNLARDAGIPEKVLKAVTAQTLEDLPSELADVARFAWAIAQGAGEADELRDRLRARFGEDGLIELALAIATAHVFPTLRRALGYSRGTSAACLQNPSTGTRGRSERTVPPQNGIRRPGRT